MQPGQRIGRFEIVSKLEEGGMGVVYRVHDTTLGRQAVVKVLHPEKARDPLRRKRFLREAQAASALNHPNIVTIYEVGCDNGTDFIAMEIIAGETLAQKLRDLVSPADAIQWTLQIAGALICAHSAGLVHRDLKPDNVMVTDSGLVKLLDFGIAKSTAAAVGSAGTAALTAEGAVIGTLAYMSPEQARGEETGPPTDVFSCGAILFELLFGRRPFDGSSQVELFHELLYADPAPVVRSRSDLPPEVTEILLRMLDKQPDRRPDASEVATVLRQAALHPGARHRNGKRRFTMLAAAALVSVLGGALWLGARVENGTNRFRSDDASASPRSSWEYVHRGRTFFDSRYRKGSIDKAAADFEAAIRLDGDNAAAYAGLADARVAAWIESPDKQLLDMAGRSAALALQKNDRLAVAHASHGWHLAMSGKRGDAVTAFDRALELDPRSAVTHLRAASNLLRLQRLGEAEKHIATALQLAPNHWEPWQHHGTLLYSTGNYQEAAKAFEKSCSIAPDNYSSQRSLGAAYFGLHRYDDAKAAFQRSLEARPTPSAFSNLGTLLYYEQQYEKAVDAFRHAIEIDANKMDLWANLGDAWRFVPGHREDSLDAYRHALRTGRYELTHKPTDVPLRCLMAATLAKSGAIDEAREILTGLAGSKIVQPDPLFLQAVAFELTGQRRQALNTLRAALVAGLPAARVESEPEFLRLRRDPEYHNLKLSTQESAAAPRR